MPDILDAVQNTQGTASVPTPPPTPPEPAPEPPIPTVPDDSLIIPPPDEPKLTETKPTEVPPVPTAGKPAKKGIKPGIIIAAILLILVTLPLTVFYVSQNKQLADVRSQAKKNERYKLNSDKYRNQLERAVLRDGIKVSGVSYSCTGGAGGTHCDSPDGKVSIPFASTDAGKETILKAAVDQATQAYYGTTITAPPTTTTAPTSTLTGGYSSAGGISTTGGANTQITTYTGNRVCDAYQGSSKTSCLGSPPQSVTVTQNYLDGKVSITSIASGQAVTSTLDSITGQVITSEILRNGVTTQSPGLGTINLKIGRPCDSNGILGNFCGGGAGCVAYKGKGTCVMNNTGLGRLCDGSMGCGSGQFCGGNGTCAFNSLPNTTIPAGITPFPFTPATAVPPGSTGTGGGITSADITLPNVDMSGGGGNNDGGGGSSGGGGGGTTPGTQCSNVRVYDAAGNTALTSTDLAALKVGDTITLGFTPPGSATKVRFKVNTGDWNETTTRVGSEFRWTYTLENTTSFSIVAQWFDGTNWN